MISTFFDKTKPINFLVLLGLAMLLFWAATFKLHGFQLNYAEVFERILASVSLLLSIFLLGNIVQKKKLTLDNSFAMLFFSLLLFVFFDVLENTRIIFCNFFLIMSWDRALALKSEKNQKEKVFESALWTLVASLFVDWAVLFLVPLYIAIGFFCGRQLRLWLMPLAAFCCVLLLVWASMQVLVDTDFFRSHYRFSTSLHFFLQPNYGIIIYLILILIPVFVVFGKMGYRRLGRTLSLRLTFAYLVLTILLLILSSGNESGIELLSFFAASVFLANYIETIKKQRFKETLIIACIALPILSFVIRLFQ